MEQTHSKGKIVSLGIQHMLAMYGGAVIVPLIVGGAVGLNGAELALLVSIDLVACGIATLLQAWKNRFFGIGLPIVMGCTFTAVSPMIIIGKAYGMPGICGAILIAGLVVLALSTFFGKIRSLFPPVVVGSVVMIIGITLIPVAINNLGGGVGVKDFGSPQNLTLGFGVLALIIIMNRFFKGFMQTISILLSIVIGTIAAAFMGKVDFSSVGQSGWFSLIAPFSFGAPTFHLDAIIAMSIVGIVSMIETTGVYLALSEICGKKIDEKAMQHGYRAEGLAILLGGFFNAFPYTTFSQNVGLVQMTRVKSRSVTVVCGVALVALGLIPKIGAITVLIPNAVIGGATLAMFGMVIASGVRMLGKVDFSRQENLLIVACAVGIGMGVTVQPALFAHFPSLIQILTNNGIVAGSLTALILNLILNAGRRTSAEPIDAASKQMIAETSAAKEV
ncbi:nucleobase:cation symporter-2 family protein [Sporolactobacillus terrae]|nr:nucleobase:cation symporter-2 family protein [Sporolactobacillus terrae]QAA21886.1 purine permease [Sporolactobacillus terrae]QAA24859.1 purine permease [Sporolactobacillus terrae]UAK16680.1 purine permease [Sporolactobacillus terrae]BBN98161.1 xanthine permease [Sporolactobacillus terrae]